MNSKNKNIEVLYRGIHEFEIFYQPRSNVVNDKNHDSLADLHNILRRWKNSQLLNVQYKSPGSDQIRADLIQTGGETLLSQIHKLIILFEIRKNYLINGRSLLLYQFTRKAVKPTVIIIMGYHCYQLN
jgi:hypothetical protein